MSLKTIAITWTERRCWLPTWEYGHPRAALWKAEGVDTDVNKALAYVTKENRRTDADYRVHTFPCDDMEWRSKARLAHRIAAKYAA